MPKRRVKARLREERRPPVRTNETGRWTLAAGLEPVAPCGSIHDPLATGTRIRILTTVDACSHFSPAIVPRFSFRAPDVIAVPERVGREIGLPRTIRVDLGSEFISRALDLWAYQRDVTLDVSRPGKPTDDAFIESLNGKVRAECLNPHGFLSLDDAVRKCDAWAAETTTKLDPTARPATRSRSSRQTGQRPMARPDRQTPGQGQPSGPNSGGRLPACCAVAAGKDMCQ